MYHYKITDESGNILQDSSKRERFEGYYKEFFAYLSAIWNRDYIFTDQVLKIDIYKLNN